MRFAKARDHVFGPRDEHLQIGICLKRRLDARKHDLGWLVPAHGVNAHAHSIHVNPLDREMADSGEPAIINST